MIILDCCPVCGSKNIIMEYRGKTTRNIDDKSNWTVFKCKDCTLGFMNPQPTWEELQPYYNSEYPPYAANFDNLGVLEKLVTSARVSGEYRHVKIEQGMRILDVGCGGGTFLYVAKKLGAEVKGIEPSEIGSASARKMGISVFSGTLPDYYDNEGRNEKFDLITSSHVLEHVPNPVEILRTMRKLIGSEGMIWIAVPNAACVFPCLLKDRWHSTDLPYHLLQFTPESMFRTASLAGLAIHRQFTDSPATSVAGSVRSILRYRWFIPRRLSERLSWIDNVYAPRLARKLDRNLEGEALISELLAE